jgi:hypothetical protein
MGVKKSRDSSFEKEDSFEKIQDIELFFHFLFAVVVLKDGLPFGVKAKIFEEIKEILEKEAEKVILFEVVLLHWIFWPK